MKRKKKEFNASILAQEVLIFSEKAERFRAGRQKLRKEMSRKRRSKK